jgi:hypothetical protein
MWLSLRRFVWTEGKKTGIVAAGGGGCRESVHVIRMTHDTWHMTHYTWHMTHATWHMSRDTCHVTHDTWHMTLWTICVLHCVVTSTKSLTKQQCGTSDSNSRGNWEEIFRGIPQSLQLNLIIATLVHNLARHDANAISYPTAEPQCDHRRQ